MRKASGRSSGAKAWEPLWKAWRAILVVLCHTVVSGVIIVCIWLTEQLIRWLWGAAEPMIHAVPLHTILLGADLVVLFAFVTIGAISAIRTFWSE